MWSQDGQLIYMRMWTWQPPTSGKPNETHDTRLVSVDLATGELSEAAVINTHQPVVSMTLNSQTGTYAIAAGYSAWGPCEDENGQWLPPAEEQEDEPCPGNRIDVLTVAPPLWGPASVLTSFAPQAFGTCDGDRFAPVWSRDGSELAFLVADCFFKVGDPFGENSVSGLAMWHVFALGADGSFSKLTPWKHEHSEDSPTWGPDGSGMIAFIKGTPGETYVCFDHLAIANMETGAVQDVTPAGFDHFYEIAWMPD